ncbi:MAG TPA: polymer-forming cytoskeletal protein [Pyrinomonadaceae bacterium]|nr:polymer-forming cytoskeletal protein [Pyrinomonadaceae bacterium]
MSGPQALGAGRVSVPKEGNGFQARAPVIIGEIHYKGTLAVNGVINGQISGNNGSLGVRQRSGFPSQPELSGEISFREMVRITGHVAGSIYSKTGTLIVDTLARIDATVEVAVAVIGGTVNGDIVAYERVELGPGARIHGNISTRSLGIKDGAIFDGVCTMIEGHRHSD